ncbi:MAG: SPOR domain-containing protein [Deltaproteobacteria bacterium]|nr:SPOR domain-containing protein [Deltaproteobacteria bacterium]
MALDKSRKTKQNWSIKLGIVQAVVLLGIVTGSMLCSFYLGLVSGQKAGFESAQALNLSTSARMPIPEEYQYSDEELTSDIYAKLSDATSPTVETEELEPVPEIGQIETTKVTRPTVKEKTLELSDVDEESDHESVLTILGDVGKKKKVDNRNTLALLDSADEKLGSLEPVAKEAQKEVQVEAEIVQKPEEVLADQSEISTRDLVKAEQSEELTVEPKKEEIIVAKIDKKTFEQEEIKEKAAKKTVEPVVAKKVEQTQEIQRELEKRKEDSSLVKTIIPGGWYAQVAAPRKLQTADELGTQLRNSGFPVLIERANIRGQEYFRVLVGPEDQRAQADRLVGQLKRESYLRGAPFIRRIR